jgi:hypothetical protein
MFWEGWEGEGLTAFAYEAKKLGYTVPIQILSNERVKAFNGWGKCESGADGTKAAKNNPCGTSLKMPGSTTFNNAGVQNYLSRYDGIQAMARMLCQQNMIAIRRAILAQPFNLKNFATAVSTSPWGTGYECLKNVYGLK